MPSTRLVSTIDSKFRSIPFSVSYAYHTENGSEWSKLSRHVLQQPSIITHSDGLHALCNIIKYLDFHSTKRALWLVDSWSRAPDQIQIYYDRDAIAQLLPARRLQQHMIV